MEKFSDFVSAITVRVAQGVGLKPTERQELARWRQKFAQDKADNQDRLDALKEEIHVIEARALQLKAKFDKAHGLVQQTIGREIEQAFRELDRKEKQAGIILNSIEANSIAFDKSKELEDAVARGLKEEHLDLLATKLEDTLADVKQAEEALAELQGIEYAEPGRPRVDVKKRTAELAAGRQPAPPLSAATMERLKQLEKDVE
jgi:predicted house-cleaning noncanonical NTP pyrophosphatase (MazG superfamily)